MTDDERELLLAVAKAIAYQDGTVDDAIRRWQVRMALERKRAGQSEVINATEQAEC